MGPPGPAVSLHQASLLPSAEDATEVQVRLGRVVFIHACPPARSTTARVRSRSPAHRAARLAIRRQGIAKELLTYALRYMSKEGAVTSFLEVRESNTAAREMYRSFGYEETGRRKRYYKDNDEDAILMTLDHLDGFDK